MNRPVHFEIHATDPEAMAKFYSTVFGWNVRHIPEFNYWTFDTSAGGDGINGGMVKRRGEKPRADCPVSAFVCAACPFGRSRAQYRDLGCRRRGAGDRLHLSRRTGPRWRTAALGTAAGGSGGVQRCPRPHADAG